MMTGYKVFNPDWTCKGFQYKVGETYEMDGEVECCERGFHFCKKLMDCFEYYCFDPKNKVAVVTALGDIDSDEDEFCTSKIRIDKELTWSEVLDLMNVGKDNDGIGNVGDHNAGHYDVGCSNKGHYNVGCSNEGDCNVGSYNVGCSNSGWYNMGLHNSGWYNEGSFNSGDNNEGSYNAGIFNVGCHNAGDYNLSDGNAGCFNTKQHTIFMFNKPTDWTITDWRKSGVISILYLLMSSKDKQKEWDELDENKKREILNLPNFDPDIFYKVTGIKV